jgi:hypothetical protein
MMITHDISDLAQQATSAPPAIIDADQFGLEDMASRAFRLSVTCGLMSAWDDSDLGLRLSYVGSSLNSGPAATASACPFRADFVVKVVCWLGEDCD